MTYYQKSTNKNNDSEPTHTYGSSLYHKDQYSQGCGEVKTSIHCW